MNLNNISLISYLSWIIKKLRSLISKKPTSGKGGLEDQSQNINNIDSHFYQEDTWKHISEIMDESFKDLTPEKQAEKQEVNVNFIIGLLLLPYKPVIQKTVLNYLYFAGRLTLMQTQALINQFKLAGV